MLFSEPKIPQSNTAVAATCAASVSVLFSEPKIPQYQIGYGALEVTDGFSALQRAENSSIMLTEAALVRRQTVVSVLFSEPKIPQFGVSGTVALVRRLRFSALQRAENSSIHRALGIQHQPARFQCSSASRKFLNRAAANL